MREHATEERSGECPDVEELLGWSLPQQAEEIPSVEWLMERLRSSKPDWRLLESLVHFEPASYARRVLARTDACELLLVCWLPGQVSHVHDHGGSSGVSWLLRGRLRETRYAWGGDRLLQDGAVDADEGDFLLEQSETIHRIHNASRHGAVSLHVYAPPMVGMTRYDTSVTPGLDARLELRGVLRPPRPPADAAAARKRRPRAM
ncbi:cysteine dioxygenase [Pyxidicoccus xibeiensis]|uniref:cysteine dioxygenase n=1 Tax=Pyxidicoccus xibeiensis TaxID=2906759 RepID=UPI0020A7C1EF|nr:cysteine dioxygenase family protein [Pyxidicoccus xibeiensis]MCP3135828.1 cysteine dioxygenase [Pyxidicoccus xibeiensis]